MYGHSDKTNSLTRKGMNIMDLKDLWSDNGHKRLLFAATLAGILCVLGVAVLVFHNFLKAIS